MDSFKELTNRQKKKRVRNKKRQKKPQKFDSEVPFSSLNRKTISYILYLSMLLSLNDEVEILTQLNDAKFNVFLKFGPFVCINACILP